MTFNSARVWVLDLDGVVWRGDTPIDGAADAIAALRTAGHRVGFATNNAYPTQAEIEAKLRDHGVDPADLLTSPQAAVGVLPPGARVLVVGGPGAREAVLASGGTVVDPVACDPATVVDVVDAVLVGLHLDFDYHRLAVAAAAARGGAPLLATNDDSTYPAHGVLLPGGGSILAAVERASGVRAVVAGKPHQPMADLVRARLGPAGVVVGDRDDTDGAFARRLGWPFGLVLSGVTAAADVPTEPAPDLVAADLARLVEAVLAGDDDQG